MIRMVNILAFEKYKMYNEGVYIKHNLEHIIHHPSTTLSGHANLTDIKVMQKCVHAALWFND